MTITKELCQQLAHCIYGGSYGANFNLFNGFIPKEILIKDVNNQDVKSLSRMHTEYLIIVLLMVL